MKNKSWRPNLLVIGHGRHGKDTVCEILRDSFGYEFISSSMFCAQEAVGDMLLPFYDSFDEMYADRSNHRALWATLISAYNTPVKTATAEGMIAQGKNIYCGMRSRDELEACKSARIFDHVVWVDRSDHLPLEPESSMQLNASDADWYIDNNGDLTDLFAQVSLFAATMEKQYG